jgi:glycerophosphoryl diester phosphodiesterase
MMRKTQGIPLWPPPREAGDGRPLILGHRGASGRLPENTLAAFHGAISDGADGFELDVHLCKSGEPVVFHDYDLQRMCGDPRRIDELSWSELSRVSIAGERIPLLDEVLQELRSALVNIEIKRQPAARLPAIVDAVARLAAQHRRRVLISSFDPRAIALLALRHPELPRALLFHHKQSALLRSGVLALPLQVDAVHPEHGLVDATRLARWHRQGRRVNVWTVDSTLRARQLADLGVDALITNNPATLVAALST